ncbi:STAS domain-containing protein [Isosphaeraceae bacterium EP7]
MLPLTLCPICGQPYAVPCQTCRQASILDESEGVPTLLVRLSAFEGAFEVDVADTLTGLAAWSADNPKAAIILDMEQIPFLGSRTLAVLLRLNRTQKSASRRLKLRNVGPDLQEIFRITRMDQLLEINAA